MKLQFPIARTAALLVPAIVCVLLLLWSMPSLLVARKVVALLILPPGMLWLGLMTMAAWPGLQRWCRSFAILILILYSLAGNSWFGGYLLQQLETPYLGMTLPAERFDAIYVLGGGSSASPDGKPQLGPSGDRLIVPVRLFLSGKTAKLVASGQNVTGIDGIRSLADQTAALWRDLGIPETSIIRVQEPRTTKEEIRACKSLIDSMAWQRVGICSSAWHLRRVEHLCRREGLKFIPVPADFGSTPLPWNPLYAIPQAGGFQQVQKALWEYLGALAGG